MEIESFDRIQNILKEISFFEEFSNEEIDYFSKLLSLRSVPKNTVLFNEGDVGDYLFFILEGLVEVQLNATHAKSVIATYGYGQCVGEMSLVDDYTRSATVQVTEQAELLILTKNQINNIVKKQPVIAAKIFKGLAKNLSMRLRGSTGRFADLA